MMLSIFLKVRQLGANRIVLTVLVAPIVAREPSTRHRVPPACILQSDSLNVKLAKLGKSYSYCLKKNVLQKPGLKMYIYFKLLASQYSLLCYI